MNFKTTAIALAVAGTVATPVVQADGSVFASARVGLMQSDTGGISDLEVGSFSSRFGMAGETDLGNGMTGYGRYEYNTDFDDDTAGGGEDDISVRQRWVGVKGDFGSAQVGQGWWTFYQFVVAPLDNPWWHTGYNMIQYRGRTDNAITYTGGSGNVKFGASLYFDRDADEESIDTTEIGVSFGIGDMTLGLASQSSEFTQGGAGTDDTIVGAALSGIAFGDVSLGFSLQSQHDDTSWVLDAGIGNAYVHVEAYNADADSAKSISGDDEDSIGITLGYTQSLGRNTTMYYEFFDWDADSGDGDDDITQIMAVLKYDIL